VHQRRRKAAGYSIIELMIVVAMVGVVTLVTVPAFVSIMPQYRIRGAASETMANLRAVRQMAVTSRRPWKVTFVYGNPPEGGQFFYSRLKDNNPDMTDPDSWERMGRDLRPLGTRLDTSSIVRVPAVELKVATDSPLHDVDCDENVDLIYLRDGTVSNLGDCADPDVLMDFDPPPSIEYTIDNQWVRFNTYALSFEKPGNVAVAPSKK
jgi:type II secretory pathway pseudopilin PulG